MKFKSLNPLNVLEKTSNTREKRTFYNVIFGDVKACEKIRCSVNEEQFNVLSEEKTYNCVFDIFTTANYTTYRVTDFNLLK